MLFSNNLCFPVPQAQQTQRAVLQGQLQIAELQRVIAEAERRTEDAQQNTVSIHIDIFADLREKVLKQREELLAAQVCLHVCLRKKS